MLLCIIPGVLHPFSGVSLFPQGFYIHFLGWSKVTLGVQLLLKQVALCGLTCHTTAYFDGFLLSQVSPCCPQGLLCFIPGVLLMLTWVARCHSRCLTVTNCSGFVWFPVSKHHSLVRLHVVSRVLQTVTLFAPHHLICPTADNKGAFVSLKVLQCCLLG